MKFRCKLMVVIMVMVLVPVSLCLITLAEAENWPPKNIEIVLPHGVDSNTSQIIRAFGSVWQEYLGTKFIYKNKPGASTRVGADYFLGQPKAKDGSVIMGTGVVANSIMHFQQKPPWNWKENMLPIGILSVNPGCFYVKQDSQYKTINDLINDAKKKKLRVAISMWASRDTLVLSQIIEQTGAKFEIIPFGSGGNEMAQVLGGHVAAGHGGVSGILKTGGKLRILSISLPKNPVPDQLDKAPGHDEALGTKTMRRAYFRAIIVRKGFESKYPQRYRQLVETFERTKKDERFKSKARKLGENPDLTVDYDSTQILQLVEESLAAFEKYGDVLKKK